MTKLSHTSPWHGETIGTNGSSFIWLHGWGQTGASFRRLAALFGAAGQHTLYDLPGFGQTAQIREDAGTEEYADSLADLLHERGDGPHIIIGHSFGGRMAIQMAARHPDLVKAIILIAGAGLPRRRSLAFKIRAFALKLLGRLARLCDLVFKTDCHAAYRARFGSSDYKNAGPLRTTFVKAVTENLAAPARLCRAPTLLIYGTEDRETPPEIGARYEQLMPMARFEQVPGFGHLDILDRGAYQCESLIRAFLKDLEYA